VCRYNIIPTRQNRGQYLLDPATNPAQNFPPDHIPAKYFLHNKCQFALRLGISIRSLDRAIAAGVIPEPDLKVGKSPRWSEQTIQAFLLTKPRLPGRGRR